LLFLLTSKPYLTSENNSLTSLKLENDNHFILKFHKGFKNWDTCFDTLNLLGGDLSLVKERWFLHMINSNVLYKATGRYMDGQRVIGYHLVGEDGSQSQENKDRVKFLIEHGIIVNMRLQTGENGEQIIRGKGVNLNNLPIFDIGKQTFRNDSTSQSAATSKVPVKKSPVADVNLMGQYKLTKRIMLNGKCIGYEIQDYSGATQRQDINKIKQLAYQRLISNAITNKYTNEAGETVVKLRGVGGDLSSLPILIVNEQGKIVDPSVGNTGFSVRAAYMKHSGLIVDTVTGKTIQFKTCDFIVCEADGRLSIKSSQEMGAKYRRDKESSSAVCDDYFVRSNRYSVEIFGGSKVVLNASMIKSWAIFKPIQNKVNQPA
jgi:hypothetical protein